MGHKGARGTGTNPQPVVQQWLYLQHQLAPSEKALLLVFYDGGTQTSERQGTTEQFVFLLNKQELCVVCCIRDITLLTNEKVDSPARRNSQEQSHPLVPGQ